VISSPASENFAMSIVDTAHPYQLGARNVKGVQLAPTSSSNYSNVTIAWLGGTLDGELVVQADTSGAGGEVEWHSGAVTGDVYIHRANQFSVGGLGVSGRVVIDELVGAFDAGHLTGDVRIGKASGLARLRVFAAMPGSLSVSVIEDTIGAFGVFFRGGIAPTGMLTFNEIEGAGSVDFTASVEGAVHFLGAIPAAYEIHVFEDLSGVISARDDIAGNIIVDGDVSGGIIADYDADGIGLITGPGFPVRDLEIGGDFSGDICDASMSATHELPFPCNVFPILCNIQIAGESSGTICAPRTPLMPVSLPHSAAKNRMISINPHSTNNREVALKLSLSSMLRCDEALNFGIACESDADCLPHDYGSCVEYRDVYSAEIDDWWIGPPIDPTCQDAFGIPILGKTCSGKYYSSHVVNTPVYRVWNEPVIHVADCEIVPAAKYVMSATEDGSNFTTGVEFSTTAKPSGKQFGDVVGSNVGATWNPPNGFANTLDVVAVLTSISSPANGPDATWADIAGSTGEGPNGLVNVQDVLLTVLASNGLPYYDANFRFNPDECIEETPEMPSVIAPGDPIALTISGSDSFLDPEEWLYVDVFTGAVDELGAYEVALEVSGGTSGTLVLADIVIDDQRSDYAFGTATTIVAKNVSEGRVGVLREGGGVEVVGTKYLVTFIYQPASGASGVFDIAIKCDGASFLSDGNAGLLPVTLGSDEVVGVGVDCWETWHCNDNNACTTDACSNYECVFTNSTQGTACNDGHFCTATDTCNGSGVCTGTGNPCPPRTHWCNEFQDQCEESLGGED